MSDDLRAWLDEVRARRESAFAMVSALCQPRGTQGSREWIMSIPARPDYDPDLVIGVALGDVDALIAKVEELAEAAELVANAKRDHKPCGVAKCYKCRAKSALRAPGSDNLD